MPNLTFVVPRLLLSVLVFTATVQKAQPQDKNAENFAVTLTAEDEDSSPTDEQSAARKKLIVAAMQKYSFVLDEDPSKRATVDQTALLRWSNPQGDVADGMQAVYTTGPGQRPAAICNIYVHGAKLRGLSMLAFADIYPGPLKLMRNDRTVWSPQTRYSKFERLPDAPEPAENPALRLVQIKKMAARFEIIDGFRDSGAEPKPVLLRMMSRPTYRYGSPDGEIIDGALFTHVVATDPEACLVIEIHRKDGLTFWEYMVLPMTIYSLDAKLDGNVVWQKPAAAVFGDSTGPFYTSRYSGDPGEPTFRSLLSLP
ncbi:MAG: hypothetical protein R3C59_02850 [Planctomycetaceae bacterium]